MRLAIVSTHPIQYYAPVFKLLNQHERIDINVFYTNAVNSADRYDPGFKKNVNWDIPMLDGYTYEFIKNTFHIPNAGNFKKIINLDIIRKIKAYNADAILVYGWANQSHLAALFYFKNKIPVYFRGDSTLLDRKDSPKEALKHLILKWIYRHIDYALYTGTNNKAYFKKNGLTDKQLIFVPHAVDNERFAADRHLEVKQLKADLGIGNEDIVILFAGKFEAKKDPLSLLIAFSRIAKTHIKLLFVGNGDLEQQLKKKAENMANVHFLDFQNQSYMPVVYQSCDIFCLPSRGPGETWGLVVNEAMACGKVILVADKAGCAIDLVDTGVNGRQFKAGDLHDLTDALDILLSRTRKELTEMGERSREIIAHWSFLKLVECIEENMLKK